MSKEGRIKYACPASGFTAAEKSVGGKECCTQLSFFGKILAQNRLNLRII